MDDCLAAAQVFTFLFVHKREAFIGQNVFGISSIEFCLPQPTAVCELRKFLWFSRLPCAGGEIGEVRGCGAVCDAPNAKRCDSRPSGGVVNVHVERQAVSQAMY